MKLKQLFCKHTPHKNRYHPVNTGEWFSIYGFHLRIIECSRCSKVLKVYKVPYIKPGDIINVPVI